MGGPAARAAADRLRHHGHSTDYGTIPYHSPGIAFDAASDCENCSKAERRRRTE